MQASLEGSWIELEGEIHIIYTYLFTFAFVALEDLTFLGLVGVSAGSSFTERKGE